MSYNKQEVKLSDARGGQERYFHFPVKGISEGNYAFHQPIVAFNAHEK